MIQRVERVGQGTPSFGGLVKPIAITCVRGLLAMIVLTAGAVKGVLAASAPSLNVSVQTEQKSVKHDGFRAVIQGGTDNCSLKDRE